MEEFRISNTVRKYLLNDTLIEESALSLHVSLQWRRNIDLTRDKDLLSYVRLHKVIKRIKTYLTYLITYFN